MKDKSTTTFDSRTRQRGCEITININCKGDVNIYNCSSPPGKGSTAAIPFASIESYMTDTLEAVEKEVQWMGSVRSNEFPDWSLSTDAFLKAFADFKALHDKQDKDTLGVYTKGALSAEYRHLAKEMQEPYATAMKHLEHLQDAVGKRTDILATYEPVPKAMKKVEP